MKKRDHEVEESGSRYGEHRQRNEFYGSGASSTVVAGGDARVARSDIELRPHWTVWDAPTSNVPGASAHYSNGCSHGWDRHEPARLITDPPVLVFPGVPASSGLKLRLLVQHGVS